MFGINIKMTYQGQHSFKTLFGAILSILVCILVAMFVGYKTNLMFTKQNTKTSKQTFMANLANEPPYFIHQKGFKFAFQLMNPLDPTFATMQVNFVNITSFNSTPEGRVKVTTPIGSQPCTKEIFGMNDQEFYSAGLLTFQCVSNAS